MDYRRSPDFGRANDHRDIGRGPPLPTEYGRPEYGRPSDYQRGAPPPPQGEYSRPMPPPQQQQHVPSEYRNPRDFRGIEDFPPNPRDYRGPETIGPRRASLEYPKDRFFRGDERAPPAEFDRHAFPLPRSRSQTKLDPEFYPTADYSPFGSRPLDKTLRSKSLDYRDQRGYDYDGGERGFQIPIKRETRNYDYERENFVPIRRGDSRDIVEPRLDPAMTMRRIPRVVARSNEFLNRRGDDRPRNPPNRFEGYSPKSFASGKKQNLNVSVDHSRRDYRPEYGREEYRSSGGGGGGYREEYRETANGGAYRGAEGERSEGGGQSRHAHSSYYHESHGGGGGGGGARFGSPRRLGGPSGHGMRPQQHRLVNCCCFRFTWPPWTVEPTEPPKQMYRNI